MEEVVYSPNFVEGLIKMLECRVCHSTMKPPIVQCMTGHNICSTCDLQLGSDSCPLCRQKRTAVRNLLAEEMCQRILYPCTNDDCIEKYLLADMASHVANCKFRVFDCPINDLCLWKGFLCNILKHVESAHGTNVWHEESTLTAPNDFSENFTETTLVSSQGELFVWHCVYSCTDGMFHGALKFVGPMEKAGNYTYVFKLTKNTNKQAIKFRNVALKETDSFSEVFQEMDNCVYINYNTVIKKFMNGARLNYQLSVKTCT